MKRASESPFQPDSRPLSVSVLAVPGASLSCVASAVDPLRVANRIDGKALYTLGLCTPDGRNAELSSGLGLSSQGVFDPRQPGELLVIVAGYGIAQWARGSLPSQIAMAARAARCVAGVDSAPWLMGRAGLLAERAATTHWEDLDDFANAFPDCEVRRDRFVIDGRIATAGAASPTLDMMLELIRVRQGETLAMSVASTFGYEGGRKASVAQSSVALGHLDAGRPRLAAAIRAMEARVEDPVGVDEIARHVGIGQRRLEQEFAEKLGVSPGRYYLDLRLAAARRLVCDTATPITEIAARTGFSSPAVFSRAFRRRYEVAPRDLRKTN